MTDDRERWTLELEAIGDDPPIAVRIKRVLKSLLRTYKLKCVRISGSPPPDPVPEKEGKHE